MICRLGFLASGSGSTFEAVVAACGKGDLQAKPAILICNNSKAGALERAGRLGIPARHISARTEGDAAAADRAIRAALDDAGVDLVVLVGYLKKIGPEVLAAHRGRIVNTHPALLPKFGGVGMYGLNVHAAVVASGDSETGVTVHVVDAEYDRGAILAQATVPVEPGDTAESLAARVQAREKPFLVETLGRLLSGELRLPA